MNPHRLHAYFLLLLVSIIWGIAGVVIKYTLGAFPPLIFLTYRFGVATIFALLSFLVVRYKIPADRKTFWVSIFYGFLTSSVALGLLFFGTEETTAIDATLISATAPITIVAAGAIFLREHVTLREKIGITIAFLGTLVTIMEPLTRNGASLAGLGGNLLVFASVLAGTVTAVLAKMLLRREVDPFYATNASFVVGFLTTAPFALLVHGPTQIIKAFVGASFPFHLGVIYMALISGSLAYTFWHKAQKTIEIGEVGLFAYLYPVFGTPLAVIWLKGKNYHSFCHRSGHYCSWCGNCRIQEKKI